MFAKMYRSTESINAPSLRPSDARRVVGRTAAIVDGFLVLAAFLPALRLRELLVGYFPLAHWQWVEQLMMMEMLVTSWIGYGAVLRLYDGRRHEFATEVGRVAWVALLSLMTLGVLAFVLDLGFLRRLLAILYVGVAFVATVGFRFVARLRVHERNQGKRRAIVIGSGAQLAELFRTLNDSGVEVAGVIAAGSTSEVPLEARHLGTLSDAESILRREVVDEVVFAVAADQLLEVEDAFRVAEDFGIETKLSLDFLPHRFARPTQEEIGRFPMLSFASAPADPIQLTLKRLFDIVVSAVALTLGAPLFLTIAVAVKLTSKGPLLFGQRRVGVNGREFTVWKFRSMVVDAEVRLKELVKHNEMSGPVFKMTRDPRVTPIGRILRKSSLDELPQFWNVLIGEMSIVGPRPPIPAEVAQYNRPHRRRLSVKPGITCVWQVSGRSEIDFDTWMKMDLDYIDRWSLWLDLKIFLQTIPAVLFGRGAA